MAERERDPRGRPLNARPRDGLGRPLPRGAAGVARVPDGLALAPDAALGEAQSLLDDGMPFHAHEILEGSWKSAPESERELWQGLAQLTVALTHALRGNTSGAVAVLRRGRDRIADYAASAPHDIDVPGLMSWADDLIAALDDPSNQDRPTVPTLRRTA